MCMLLKGSGWTAPFQMLGHFYYDPHAATRCDWPVLVTGPAQDTVAREGQEACLRWIRFAFTK